MDYQDVIAGGFENLFDTQFDYLFSVFDLSGSSPAINNGTVLPVEWPDIIEVTDGNPDIGAIEHA